MRSFFIWMELSSGWATLKMRSLQFFHVRCCFNRNGSNMRRPPSWTIHQISMLPLTLSPESGNLLIPLGTKRAIFAAAVLRIVSTNTRHESSSFLRQLFGQPSTMVLGFMPPSPAVCILCKNCKHIFKHTQVNMKLVQSYNCIIW